MKQIEFYLDPYARGYHIITKDILNKIGLLPQVGILHLFIKHTSAAITINESADSDVLVDFESIFNMLVPENLPFLKHTIEGPDDMPAHVKATIIGHSLSIPIANGSLNLGTWQGIYLCEFRNRATPRKFVATIIG
jgi:secondary thiamine-phosphate synthase enzyme